jgi:hypothetical protein
MGSCESVDVQQPENKKPNSITNTKEFKEWVNDFSYSDDVHFNKPPVKHNEVPKHKNINDTIKMVNARMESFSKNSKVDTMFRPVAVVPTNSTTKDESSHSYYYSSDSDERLDSMSSSN